MNRNIHYDRQKPSTEEILSHRDFDALLKQYKQLPGRVIKPPFWRTRAFYASATAVAAVLAGVIYFVAQPDLPNQPGKQQAANNPKVQPDTVLPPAPKVAAIALPTTGYTSKRIQASANSIIRTPGGITVTITPNSLAAASGQAVSGEIELRYRELSDPVDMLLSNIPMSNEQGAWAYESAAMIEVQAYQNGRELHLLEGQQLDIQLPVVAGFSPYRLEASTGNWNPQQLVIPAGDVAPVAPLSAEEEERLTKAYSEEERRLVSTPMPDMPKPPRAANPKRNRFNVDFASSEFPEMSSWRGVVFEVEESRIPFDPNTYRVEWEDVKVQKVTTGTGYQLQLKKGVRTQRYDVYPVLEGAAFEQATLAYNAAVARRDAVLQERAGMLTALIEKYEVLRKPQAVVNSLATATGSILTNRFGVFGNLKRILYPGKNSVSLTLLDENNQPLAVQQVHHIDRSRNTAFTWGSNPIAEFRYAAASRNLLWAVSNGRLYTANAAQFAAGVTASELRIQLNPVPASACVSAAALRSYMGF